ncbi:hypothetical protein ACWD5R_32485 [Streptomyces sp. NPDC002514]|uniref:hypothetical protein n=1 Tax=Streptomyces sp. NPDC001270 TaxID=3364554 RepID=UPI00367FD99F
MNISLRNRGTRAVGTGALSLALLSAGAAGAYAANATPSPRHPVPHGATYRHGAAAISVRATPTVVRHGEQVRFSGRASGLRTGTPVYLQQERGGRWTTLHSHARVDGHDRFSFTDRPDARYTQHFRVASGRTHSPTVAVTVR